MPAPPASTPPTCIVTNGGPLIALPGALLVHWQGTDADDYDRACDPTGSILVGDGYEVWSLQVGHGTALVVDGECSTTSLPVAGGVVLVRDVGLASLEELRAIIDAVTTWEPTPFHLELTDGHLSVFDAAYPGADHDNADGGALDLTLPPGPYRVSLACPIEPQTRMTLVRLHR